MKIESILYDKLDDERVQCNVCNHHCLINDSKCGYCLTRKNEGGTLYSYNFALISSANVDPIEKKPLYHFLPTSLTYSLGGFRCNMGCLNCQNYIISQSSHNKGEAIEILPEVAVKNAIDRGCKSIAFTYNEPTIYLEYVLQTAILSHKKGLKNIFISNGYMSSEALNLLLPHIDGFNIDLKSMSNDFYKKICKATVGPILDNLKKIYNNNKHLEITNLLIDGFNDSEHLIKDFVDFIANELGEEVPLHFSRFFPYYKMGDVSPTSIETLKKAKEIAIDAGLKYVYLGNVQTDQNSYCPNCGELLIERNGYDINDKNGIKDNKCINCNENLNFIC
ncbi:MAG: AmmeMemoRadiSam system radical SAM enzyme [Methanobrevibacter sp.]|nr:AmmeMemoRadiSam system radical SAM enzyme [Methanobrevibacter sp.]MCL2157416.1 AmmeMemoRadiSam system radical SAM enzyme [Methanobrevibacter sp.]